MGLQVINVKDRKFKPLINVHEIEDSVNKIAKQINRDYLGRSPIFIIVLNGAFMFASDLLKKIDVPCRIVFTKLSSYKGTESTGEVRKIIGIHENLANKDLIIIEDIVDKGITMDYFLKQLKEHNPASIKIATLFFKPEAFTKKFSIDYIAIKIKNKFIVGYGLDYDGFGRNLKMVYELVE